MYFDAILPRIENVLGGNPGFGKCTFRNAMSVSGIMVDQRQL